MPLLRLALAVVGATALAGAALAQSDGATPLPPQRPAVQEPAAQAPTPLPAAEGPAPDPGQQATMMPAPDVAPPPGIGQLDQIASSKALDPSTLTADEKAALDRVDGYLNALRVMSGSFTQVNPDGTRSTGQFWISKPGKMRFQYAPPSPVELVADGRSLAVRDRKLNTQDLYYISQTPLRFLLADKIDLNADSRVVDISLQKEWIQVTLEEKSTFAGTARILLMFSAADAALKQWTVTDAQGYETTVALFDVDTSSKPSDKLFFIDEHRTL